jgi:hypothetical protein
VFTLCAFFWIKEQGASDALARTTAVNAITIGQTGVEGQLWIPTSP